MPTYIYGPQDFSAGTFSKLAYFQTATVGGGDADITNYPELVSGEDIKTVDASGPSGERVADVHTDYVNSGLVIGEIGGSNGFDAAGGVLVEWDQYFRSANVVFPIPAQLVTLVSKGRPGHPSDSLFLNAAGLSIEVHPNSGSGFHWRYSYDDWNLGSVTTDDAAARTADNAWHHMKVRFRPGTVVGAYTDILTDGVIDLYQDDVLQFSTGSIALYASPYQGPPTDYTGTRLYGAWLGYYTLVGPFTNFSVRSEAVTVAPIPVATSLAPVTPCNPQTQVGNGGKGQSGCNTGGVGWTSGYSGPYGAAPVYSDPADGETLTGKRGVDFWVELVHTDYPSGTQTTYRRSLVELADLSTYRGGRKPAGLLALGEVEHGLGNEQGGYEAATVDLTFSDTLDRLFRDLLVDQELEGDEVRICAATPEARAAGTAPRILARAIVQQSLTNSVLEANITAVDALFSDFGPFGPDRQWPSRLIPDGVWTNTPPDSLKLPIPHLYGEKSDDGATDPETGAANPKALIPLIYVGQEVVTGGPSTATGIPTSGTPPPSYPTYQMGPLGGDGNFISDGTVDPDPYHGVARIDGGVLTMVDYGRASTPSPVGTVFGFRIVWHDPNATPPDGGYFVFQVPAGYPDWDPFSNPAPAGTNIRYKTVSGAQTDPFTDWEFGVVYFASIDDGAAWPPVAGSTTDTWDAYLVHLGAGFRILSLYGSDLGNGDPAKQHDRVLLDPTTRSDVLGPDWTWPFATRYREYVLADGTTLWLTMVYARGPLSDDHKNGVCTLACNAIGREATGDGTGYPIIDAHVAQQSWLENDILNDYTSGLAVTASTNPTWEDGTAKARSTSFAAAQALAITKFGLTRGLTVGWYADTPRSLSDWFREWNRSTETRLGTNGHGQIMLGYLNDAEDRSAWPRVDHVADLFGEVQRVPGQERENVVTGECDWDPDAEKFRVAPVTVRSAQAIRKYKSREKAGEQPVSSTILNDESQLRKVLEARLQRLKLGETMVEVTGPLGFLDWEVNTGILLNTIEGVGASGDVAKPYKILRRRTNLAPPALVTYSLLDVELRLVDIAASAEGFHIVDTVQASGLMPTETLRLRDTVTARLNDISASKTDTLHVGDSVSAVRV